MAPPITPKNKHSMSSTFEYFVNHLERWFIKNSFTTASWLSHPHGNSSQTSTTDQRLLFTVRSQGDSPRFNRS